MITEEVIKIYQKSIERLNELIVPDLSGAVISFSNTNKTEEYIYTGEEKIPFNNKNSKFQQILKNEFLRHKSIF